MLKLADFFQPLSFLTLFYFLVSFLFFDILGTFIKNKILNLSESKNSRIINWLIGFGFFVFLWFVLSLFIPQTRQSLLISVAVLFLISIKYYLKEKAYKSFFNVLWEFRIPILIIIPFLPAVFVKASLPPYYGDEMAYHFLAPSSLMNITSIKYPGGIYADLPRILDFFWQQVFTLFHTYSIARLFHFTILATSMVYVYAVLKKNFNALAAFLFVFIFFSLPQDIILTSTLGYIDVGAYSFLLIGLVSAIDFLISKNPNSVILSALFWAMNLGTKYTGITTFLSFISVFLILIVFKRKEYSHFFSLNLISKIILVMLFFGGYWYVKNFIWFGNPIFPFIFHCWGNHIEICPATGSFFGDWTTKVIFSNVPVILKELFPKNGILQLLVIISPLVALFSLKRKTKLVSFFVTVAILLEFVLLKYFSGFYIRYHQHMQLYLLIGLVLTITSSYRNKFISLIVRILLVLIIVSSIYLYLYAIRNTNSLRFLNWNEINYSIGKMNIYEWVNFYLPKMNDVVTWCENPPKGEYKLARFDPDLIWFDYDGYMRSFITNCDYINPPLEGSKLSDILQTAKDQKMRFWITSTNACLPQDKVGPKHPNERPDMIELRKLNNIIICNSKEVKRNLYYFDYSILNK